MARWLVIAPSLALSEGGLSGGEGGEAGELADGSRRRSPLRYTAGVRASFLSLLLLSSPFHRASPRATTSSEPRLRTCDNETMAGLTECEYIYIYIYIEANNEHYSCIEMSVNNRHPPPPSNSKSGSVERGGRGRKGGGGRNASGMVKKSIRR